ncbi:MAG: hypothetical protein B5M48_01950 [Candidatus Omnitrophica bacterium 4484_213]|nr:MAG: hypothetical protein B5M48_01950 [Candidatus Omnitrophica bacterium 4484_213]
MRTTINGGYPKISGKINQEDLNKAKQETIRRAIKEQEEAGLDLIGDGLIVFEDLFSPFADAWQGIRRGGLERFFDNNTYYRHPIIEGKIVFSPSQYGQDLKFAKSVANKPLKAILPGPFTFAKLSEDKFYSSEKELLTDLTAALIQEAKEISDYVEVIQFDEPSLLLFPEKIELVKKEFQKIKQELNKKIVLSLYFSPLKNFLSSLSDFPIDGLVLDAITNDNLETIFQFLRQNSYNKELTLGCIDARNTKLESKEELKKILTKIKTLLPEENIYPAPDSRCGVFISPNCSLEFLPHTTALTKMKNMVEAVNSR